MTDPTQPPGTQPPAPIHHTGTFPAVTGHTGTFPAVTDTGMIPVVAAPPRPRGATALAVVLSITGTALLVTIVGVIWFGTSGGPTGQRGTWSGPVAYPEGLDEATGHNVRFSGDTVYFRSTSADGRTWITAADSTTGAKKWSLDEGLDTGEQSALTYIDPGRDAILVNSSEDGEDTTYLIEKKTGEAHSLSRTGDDASYRMIGGVPVSAELGEGLVVLDADGGTRWEKEDAEVTASDLVAVATSKDRDSNLSGNPVDAKRLLSLDYRGTVTIYDTLTGEVVAQDESAIETSSSVLLVLDDVLYAKSSGSDTDVITAYDMTDDYAEIDSWEGEEGQNLTRLVPCGGDRVCASGYSSEATLSNIVIDHDEGIVWQAPDDLDSSYAYVSFAGDTMAMSYLPDYTTQSYTAQTRLYDEDFEEIGEPVEGWFHPVDDETFASVSSPREHHDEPKTYDAQVTVIDGADGRVSRLDAFPAYPGCAIAATTLACATDDGYRVWSYRG